MSDERTQLAEKLLQEAVYKARGRQAAGVGLSGGRLDAPSEPGGCGLGEKPSSGLELTPEGEELVRELFGPGLAPTQSARLRDVLTSWVARQDALDRKRNHFLRDFRRAHGFDRRAYSAEEAQAFEDGLARINADVEEQRRVTAAKLLEDA